MFVKRVLGEERWPGEVSTRGTLSVQCDSSIHKNIYSCNYNDTSSSTSKLSTWEKRKEQTIYLFLRIDHSPLKLSLQENQNTGVPPLLYTLLQRPWQVTGGLTTLQISWRGENLSDESFTNLMIHVTWVWEKKTSHSCCFYFTCDRRQRYKVLGVNF